jgi:pimeloyl-ACP methyl ester carboxylesterase
MDDQAAVGERGSEAPPSPARADPIAGRLVTEMLEYDGGRQVTVYVPPDPPEAVVFAGDGEGISQWGGLLEAADVPSTMIVGVHGLADETSRLHEYSPVFDANRFAAHERFFVEDVRRWARSRFGVALPTARTAVFGVSAGGELALALGLRHPDIYGAVLSGSPGAGYNPTGGMPSSMPRLSRRRHAGAVLPRQRDPVGGRAARCRCGRRHERAGRVARRRAVARRVPADGGVGVWTRIDCRARDAPALAPDLAGSCTLDDFVVRSALRSDPLYLEPRVHCLQEPDAHPSRPHHASPGPGGRSAARASRPSAVATRSSARCCEVAGRHVASAGVGSLDDWISRSARSRPRSSRTAATQAR